MNVAQMNRHERRKQNAIARKTVTAQDILGGKDITDFPLVTCSCGGDVFYQGVQFRRVSALMNKTGQDVYLNSPVTYCAKCKAVLPAKP